MVAMTRGTSRLGTRRLPMLSAESTAEYALIAAALVIAVLATVFALGGVIGEFAPARLSAEAATPPAVVQPSGHRPADG